MLHPVCQKKIWTTLMALLLLLVGVVWANSAFLTGIRHTSSESYTRVVMELSTEVQYEAHVLKADPLKGLPPRIYVDLLSTRLGLDATQPILIQDGLLRQVRMGQFTQDVVRVVLDMRSLSGYRAFLLPDPYRLVVDIEGQREGTELATVGKGKAPVPARKGKRPPAKSLRKIVLDPGHGGKDPGAIGPGGVAEKDIVLGIAKRLAQKLRKDLGVKVVLTRQDDSFIPLEDRTAIANAENADLFISIHTNASPNHQASGIETYYLNNTDDEASMRLAERENGASRRSLSDLQFILSDLTQNSKLEDSISLAHHLHSSMVSHISRKHGETKDLGVKKALFHVLVGAHMPSALAEILFITNRTEARQLARKSYQDTIVEALFQGIKKYHQSTLVAKNL